jgi:hypothetical protein
MDTVIICQPRSWNQARFFTRFLSGGGGFVAVARQAKNKAFEIWKSILCKQHI